jgi:hypothetical protein
MKDHRWGYLVNSIAAVAPLQFALQQYWDVKAMTSGEGGPNDPVAANALKPPRVTNADIQEVNTFIASRAHWSYLQMLQSISNVVKVAEVMNLSSALVRSCFDYGLE